jgi:COP9 signalosome complex subunit 6
VVAGLSAQRNAISMLHSRIGGILEYLSAVQQGQTEPDHETLRQISSLVSSITSTPTSAPAASTEIPSTSSIAGNSGLTSEFEQEQNDVLLTSLLGMMTKNLEDVNVLVDKFGITQTKEQGGREDDLYGLAGHGRMNRAGGGGGGGGKRGFADSRRRG